MALPCTPESKENDALHRVKARFPRLKTGVWTVNTYGGEPCVTYRYAGRQKPSVEVWVHADGRLETVDGEVLS